MSPTYKQSLYHGPYQPPCAKQSPFKRKGHFLTGPHSSIPIYPENRTTYDSDTSCGATRTAIPFIRPESDRVEWRDHELVTLTHTHVHTYVEDPVLSYEYPEQPRSGRLVLTTKTTNEVRLNFIGFDCDTGRRKKEEKGGLLGERNTRVGIRIRIESNEKFPVSV